MYVMNETNLKGATMELSRATVKAISADAEQALQSVAKKYGLTVERGNGNFSSTSFMAKFEFSLAGENRDATAFKTRAMMYGLKESDLGRSFKSNGETFTISGLATKAKKFPILATNSKGQTYKFSASNVKLYLSR
jgi:hypothetical protein